MSKINENISTTRKLIKRILSSIEKDHKIKILFAVENGSRAWGFESDDSDYDIRFVYKRSISSYFEIEPRPDVINQSYDSKGNPAPVEDCLIDISGFDILKFAKLLKGSNPTVIEWLNSDIVYYGRQTNGFKKYAEQYFSSEALYYHYISLCKNHFLGDINTGKPVTYKKYLYAMRGLLNALYVSQYNAIPPIKFEKVIERVNVPEGIKKAMEVIINKKKNTKESQNETRIGTIDSFLESYFSSGEMNRPNRKKAQNAGLLNAIIKKQLF